MGMAIWGHRVLVLEFGKCELFFWGNGRCIGEGSAYNVTIRC